MYKNKYVVSIIANQTVIQDFNGEVPIEFGTEYKIRLQNKNYFGTIAKVMIDGENVTGSGLFIPGNQTVELERPCDKGRENKFKFVSAHSDLAKAAQKSSPNSNNGKIRVEYYSVLNNISPIVTTINNPHPGWYPQQHQQPRRINLDVITTPNTNPYNAIKYNSGHVNGLVGTNMLLNNLSSSSSAGACSMSTTTESSVVESSLVEPMGMCMSARESGVTVGGSHSKQQFQEVSVSCGQLCEVFELSLVRSDELSELQMEIYQKQKELEILKKRKSLEDQVAKLNAELEKLKN